MRGYLREGLYWSDIILVRSTNLQTTPQYAYALSVFADLAMLQGKSEHVEARIEQSLAIYRAIGDEKEIMTTLGTLGTFFFLQGDLLQSRRLLEETLVMARKMKLRRYIGVTDICLGNVLLQLGDYTAARSLLEESLAIDRELDDPGGEAVSLSNLSILSLAEGDEVDTITFSIQSLVLCQKLNHIATMVSIFETIGAVAARRSDFLSAARLFAVAETFRQTTGIVRTPFDEELFKPYLLTVQKAVVSDATIAASWAEGQAMTIEQAIAYAQEVPPVVPQATTPVVEPVPLPAKPSNPAGLSAREVDVLRLVAQGLTDAQVAEQLVLSPRTINAHLVSIYSKLGVNSRAAATRFAVENSLT